MMKHILSVHELVLFRFALQTAHTLGQRRYPGPFWPQVVAKFTKRAQLFNAEFASDCTVYTEMVKKYPGLAQE